ncbi:hypothetical protein GQ43DRAFT_363352 [Delitschia confertaspora ATCC 74209]|uniref:Uncharacterized protein n=1 Tax=Delitschia confertaspora ATCC 74209 TaxID=1513339 RepID=A0A9P4JYS9_9PLEO|nr:hypothetical protein GQ43DRAFT_363352 [Delitschia confertaspora ATCC 74209]
MVTGPSCSLGSNSKQLEETRLAIPRVLQTLHTSHSNPVAFYKDFKQAAVGATNDLKAFRSQWQSQETQSIFEHARGSLASNADLSSSPEIPKWGWIEASLHDKELPGKPSKDDLDDSNYSLTSDAISETVAKFTEENNKLSVRFYGNQRIKIKLKAGFQRHHFLVTVDEDANGRRKLRAECLGNSTKQMAVTRSLASRPRANDLRYLLDMIAAYTNMNQVCAKCSRRVDGSAMTPPARRSRQVDDPNGNPMTVWENFHEDCLG